MRRIGLILAFLALSIAPAPAQWLDRLPIGGVGLDDLIGLAGASPVGILNRTGAGTWTTSQVLTWPTNVATCPIPASLDANTVYTETCFNFTTVANTPNSQMGVVVNGVASANAGVNAEAVGFSSFMKALPGAPLTWATSAMVQFLSGANNGGYALEANLLNNNCDPGVPWSRSVGCATGHYVSINIDAPGAQAGIYPNEAGVWIQNATGGVAWHVGLFLSGNSVQDAAVADFTNSSSSLLVAGAHGNVIDATLATMTNFLKSATFSVAGALGTVDVGNQAAAQAYAAIGLHDSGHGGSDANFVSTGGTGANDGTLTVGAATINLSGATTAPSVALNGATSGSVKLKSPAVAGANTLTFPAGTTDFSATGGTSQVVKQATAGGAFTVGQLAASDLSNGVTGTGAVALASGPTLTSPLIQTAALQQKVTASAAGPGAGQMKFEVVAGTSAGTCKLQAYAGTSATPVTIVDNVGASC